MCLHARGLGADRYVLASVIFFGAAFAFSGHPSIQPHLGRIFTRYVRAWTDHHQSQRIGDGMGSTSNYGRPNISLITPINNRATAVCFTLKSPERRETR